MNVLVTGGAGFIGSHLIDRLLTTGHTPVVVDDFNDFYDPQIKRRNVAAFAQAVPVCEVDICNTDALAQVFAAHKFETVVHLAARAGVRPSLEQPDLYTRVNILGTKNLLELARRHQVHKFIFGSSSSVYGTNQRVPFAEHDPIFKPISPYAATKLAGEAFSHVYHHLYDLDVACLRFFTVYGPRQRPDLAIHKFTRAINQGLPVEIYGTGAFRRDFTYVDDITDGIMACLDRQFGFEIINLGGAETHTVLELVRLIEQQLGRTAILKFLPTQPGDVPITYADVSKAARLLAYQPKVQLPEGVATFVTWYQNQSATGV